VGDPSAPSAWFITTGEAGFRTQARGLASRVTPNVRELTVDIGLPARALPGAMAAPFVLANLTAASDKPAPPWPDILISCGRRTTAVAIAIRRASGGKTLAVHIQNPLTAVSAFDLVVAMDHDGVSGDNVLNVPTALHDVTPERLAAAAETWRGRLAQGDGPMAGVLLGGTTRHHPFTIETAGPLIDGLATLRAAGWRLAITPSRRTPDDVLGAIADRFAGDAGAYVWDRLGENPYLAILALSDRIVATSDSVSMISEALATPHPVEVWGAEGGARHAAFLNGLIDKGLVRRFTGDPSPPPAGGPIDATGLAAEAVRLRLQARTGVVG
jgi:mitochondrial fission protein ELM1